MPRRQEEIYAALEHLLLRDRGAGYGPIARRLGLSEGTVKVAAHRLRRRYRKLLRDEIAHTVSDPGLVDEEIRQLLASL